MGPAPLRTGTRDSAPIAMFVGIVPTPEWHDATGSTSDPPRAAPALVATVRRKHLAHPRRPARAGTLRRVPLAFPAGGPVGCPVLRHASRSDRVLDGDGRLETRDGPRLENGASKDDISPAEGANTHNPRCQDSFVIPQ